MYRIAPFAFAMLATSALAAPPVVVAPTVPLQDVNPRSATHGLEVSASDFRGQFGLWYFRDVNCEACASELKTVRKLWQELADGGLEANVFTVVSGAGANAVRAPGAQSTTWLIDNESAGRTAWGASAGDLLVVAPDGSVRARIPLGEGTEETSYALRLEYEVEVAAFDAGTTDAMVTSR